MLALSSAKDSDFRFLFTVKNDRILRNVTVSFLGGREKKSIINEIRVRRMCGFRGKGVGHIMKKLLTA